jgi:hypothetical protein
VFRLLKWLRISTGLVLLAFMAVAIVLITLQVSPSTGVNGADFLRKVFGDQVVADMEMILLRTQDAANQQEYALGLIKPETPWKAADSPASAAKPPQSAVSTPSSSIRASVQARSSANTLPSSGKNSGLAAQSDPAWVPKSLAAMGTASGEGVWQPYLKDASGKVIAYRTFLQPDPKRPYAYTAVVAFDLTQARLHFNLGFAGPYAPGVRYRASGKITADDMTPGVLVAAFNGGFKYEHGHSGAMAAGLTAVPPQDGLGTLAIYPDGHVRIGEWGRDFNDPSLLEAFRQNGPLVIDNGQINERIKSEASRFGLTVNGETVTGRSGVALNSEGTVLYYFAGYGLTIDTLAQVMRNVHSQYGVELDINNYWVEFTAVVWEDTDWQTEALFPREMGPDQDRFMAPFARDFFYVTALQRP